MTASQFRVFVNGEGRYGILPCHIDTPDGWEETGFVGTREACIAYVDRVWPKIIPTSVTPAS